MPQDRTRPGGIELRLSVVRIRPGGELEPDPIVHLIGGPGGSTDAYGTTLGGAFGLGLAEATRREFIFFDQRGTGRSSPRLDCLEAEAFDACLARLAGNGVDVASFNSEENAADVDDLRAALGYATVNLYGQSYGTLLALTVMRRSPAGVRSALLEGVSSVPYDALFTNSPASFELALGRAFAECGADAACAAAFPEREQEFASILEVIAGESAEVQSAIVNQFRLLLNLAQGTSYVPLYVHGLATGDEAIIATVAPVLDELAALEASAAAGFTPLMNATMNCYDYAPLYTDEAEARSFGSAPPPIVAVLGETAADARAQCEALPPGRVSEAQRQPVRSDVPALLLGGTHDGNTPIETAAQVLANLPNGHAVTLPGWGHILLPFESPCGLEVARDFFFDPGASPTTACLASSKTVFVTEATAAP